LLFFGQLIFPVIFATRIQKQATENEAKRFGNEKVLSVFIIDLKCPGGEIGRRTVFRSQRSQGCAGSNPVLGTYKVLTINTLSGFCFLSHIYIISSH
jgi:hypothetical protein